MGALTAAAAKKTGLAAGFPAWPSLFFKCGAPDWSGNAERPLLPRLGGVQVVIESSLSEQFAVAALLEDPLVADIQNPVAGFDGGEAMGDDERGPPFYVKILEDREPEED